MAEPRLNEQYERQEATAFRGADAAAVSWLERSALDLIVEQIPPVAINPRHWGVEGRFRARTWAFLITMQNLQVDGKWFRVP